MHLSVYAAYSLCMTYTVEVEALTKTFGQTRALDGVDLRITTGTIYGLLGPNGAGKTTLVRILATLVRPDAGTALVAGHDLVADGRCRPALDRPHRAVRRCRRRPHR